MKRFAAVILSLCLVLAACSAFALDYPTKEITVIVPFNAGGNADLSMRALCETANTLGTFFNGQKLVVENVGGGGAVIGQTKAWKAPTDGYTLMLYSTILNTYITTGCPSPATTRIPKSSTAPLTLPTAPCRSSMTGLPRRITSSLPLPATPPDTTSA